MVESVTGDQSFLTEAAQLGKGPDEGGIQETKSVKSNALWQEILRRDTVAPEDLLVDRGTIGWDNIQIARRVEGLQLLIYDI